MICLSVLFGVLVYIVLFLRFMMVVLFLLGFIMVFHCHKQDLVQPADLQESF